MPTARTQRSLLALAVLAACGSGESSATVGGAPQSRGDDSGTSVAVTDAGGAEAGVSDAGLEECPTPCSATLSWKDVGVLPTARDHHVTFVAATSAGAFLYLAGGNDYRQRYADVWSAAISNDGTLGPWTAQANMPGARAGHTVSVIGSTVVIAGGLDASGIYRSDVFVAEIANDGSVSNWRSGPHLPEKRFHHSAATSERFVYVTGGVGTEDATDTVFRAEVMGGSVGNWAQVATLPLPRSHHASVVCDGALYVIAGESGSPAASPDFHDEIYRSPIGQDGSLGTFTAIGHAQTPVVTSAAWCFGGYLYVAGGMDDLGEPTNRVVRATLAADGRLGAWEQVAKLPSQRMHLHTIPRWDRYLYAAGGSTKAPPVHDLTDAVSVGTLRW